jgi:hypothetical protein
MIVSAMKELRKAEKSFGSFYNKLGRNNSLREEGADPGSYSQFIRPNQNLLKVIGVHKNAIP